MRFYRRTRYNYWSCSKVAHWIGRTFGSSEKPKAATLEGWSEWKKSAKQRPFVYWFTETLLNKIQDVVCWPGDVMYSISVYVHNRWIDKTHMLQTRLDRGVYHEFDTRLLHGMFEELADFVEVECAGHHLAWGGMRDGFKQRRWYHRFIPWRCAEAGIDYLNWAMNLTDDWEGSSTYGQPSGQARDAVETWELYNWWRNIRPNRKDSMEASGWYDACGLDKASSSDMLELLMQPSPMKGEALERLHQLDEQYEQEDTEMMLRLVMHRHKLWT